MPGVDPSSFEANVIARIEGHILRLQNCALPQENENDYPTCDPAIFHDYGLDPCNPINLPESELLLPGTYLSISTVKKETVTKFL